MRPTTKLRIGTKAAVAAVALLALVGAACRPVQPPWVELQDPTGGLELVEGDNGEVRVVGWATQMPPPAANVEQRTTQIVVLIDGQWADGAVPADDPRGDIDAILLASGAWFYGFRQPGMGYGFDFTRPAPQGEVTVCVAALNQFTTEWATQPEWWGSGPPEHVLLGCHTVTVT